MEDKGTPSESETEVPKFIHDLDEFGHKYSPVYLAVKKIAVSTGADPAQVDNYFSYGSQWKSFTQAAWYYKLLIIGFFIAIPFIAIELDRLGIQ